MNYLKYLFTFLYRIWFYILVILPILFLFPVLVLSILKESWYPFFFKLARVWAKFILIGMGMYPKVVGEVHYKNNCSYMFVANHTSMIDIMLMLSVVKNPFVFVGKKELSKIPLFGFFYKRTCILVDRDNPKSRREVFASAQRKLNQGLSVCIFPEGGVPEESILLDTFKDGAFRLALEHQIPVAPMTFHDNKKRFSYTFFSGGPGILRVTLSPVIPTVEMDLTQKRRLKEITRNIILEELMNPSK